jgi:hypothetical protein
LRAGQISRIKITRRVGEVAPWQTVAVLIGVIVFFGCQPCRADALWGNKDYITEIGCPSNLKCIVVGNRTPEMEAFDPFVNFPQFGNGQITIKNGGMRFALTRTHSSYTARTTSLLWGNSEIEIVRDASRSDSQPGQYAHVIGWRLTVIDDSTTKFEANVLPPTLSNISAGFDKNISPQLATPSIFRGSHQIARSEPQQDGNKGKERLPKLDSDKRYFGSVLACVFCVWAAWQISRRCRVCGNLIFLYALGGLLGRFDLYSIFLMLSSFAN